jgi:hypothetical protein
MAYAYRPWTRGTIAYTGGDPAPTQLVVGDAAFASGLGIKAAVNPQPACGSLAPKMLQSTADHCGVAVTTGPSSLPGADVEVKNGQR